MIRARSTDMTLLMIHGASGGAWYFDGYVDYFKKKGLNAIAIDLRGHGSHAIMGDYRLDDYVDDVILAAKRLDQSKLVILGHSMGAAVVLKALEKDPTLCQQAILMSPPPISGIDDQSPLGLFFDDMMSYLRKSRKEGLHEGMDLGALLSYMMFNDRLEQDALKHIRKRLVRESALIKADLLKPYIQDVKKITTPLVIISSDADRLVAMDDLKVMSDRLKADLKTLHALPHFMMLDPDWRISADAVLDVIKGFKQV